MILDQLEEILIGENPKKLADLENFLNEIANMFGNPNERPKGKLILGFRKEWFAELEKHLNDKAIPFGKMFLETLDRRGMMEAVTGLTKDKALVDKFGLVIREERPGELAETIAGDLLEDHDSPNAPTLQILLSKMWQETRAKSKSRPMFTLELYQQLKKDGILLKDFLDQQLEKIKSWNAEVVDSGLVLDILAFHTTPLGSSQKREPEEIAQTYLGNSEKQPQYQGRQKLIPELIKQTKEAKLLTDTSPEQENLKDTRLAHDTLAPHVALKFETSIAPGQRARRLMENKATDWQNDKVGSTFDEADLAVVEAGLSGMRVLTKPEEDLFIASRQKREEDKRREEERLRQQQEDADKLAAAEQARREAEEKRLRQQLEDETKLRNTETQARKNIRRWLNVALSFLAIAIVAAIFAFNRQIAARRAEAQALHAEQLTRAKLLSAQGEVVFERNPALGLALALEGWERVPLGEQSVKKETEGRISSLILKQQLHEIADNVEQVYPFPDNTKVILDRTSQAGEIRQLSDGRLLASLPGEVESFIFGPDDKWFVIDYKDAPGELRFTTNPETLFTLLGEVDSLIFNQDSENQWFVVDYDKAPGEIRYNTQPDLKAVALSDEIESLIFSPDDKWFVLDYTNASGDLRYNAEPGEPTPLSAKVDGLIFDPNGQWFVVDYIDAFGELRYFAEPTKKSSQLRGTVQGLTFSRNNEWVLVNYVWCWAVQDWLDVVNVHDELREIVEPEKAIPLTYGVSDVIFIPDSKWFLVVDKRDFAELIDVTNPTDSIPFFNFDDNVEQIDNSLTMFLDCRNTDIGACGMKDHSLEGIFASPNSPGGCCVVNDYHDKPDQLVQWGRESGIPLSGEVQDAQFSPDWKWVIIKYEGRGVELPHFDEPGTAIPLRASGSGVNSLQMLVSPLRSRFVFLSSRDAQPFAESLKTAPINTLNSVRLDPIGEWDVVDHDNAPDEVREVSRPEIPYQLNFEVASAIFDGSNQSLFLVSDDGHSYLLDLTSIHIMNEKGQDIIGIGCELSWDLGMIDSKELESYLGDSERKACLPDTSSE